MVLMAVCLVSYNLYVFTANLKRIATALEVLAGTHKEEKA